MYDNNMMIFDSNYIYSYDVDDIAYSYDKCDSSDGHIQIYYTIYNPSIIFSNRIKELLQSSANNVNQVEFMAALTTSRFQTINEMNALKETLLQSTTSPNNNQNNNHNNNNSNNNHITASNGSILDGMSLRDSFMSFDSNHNYLFNHHGGTTYHHPNNNHHNNNNSNSNNYITNAKFEELKSEIFNTNFKYNLGE